MYQNNSKSLEILFLQMKTQPKSYEVNLNMQKSCKMYIWLDKYGHQKINWKIYYKKNAQRICYFANILFQIHFLCD